MKTSEFIKKMEAMGLKAEKIGTLIRVFKRPSVYADVSTDKTCKISTFYSKFNNLDEKTKQELLENLTEYASTPLEEREEKNRYKYKLKDLGRALENENECSWLIYNNQCHKLVLGYVNNSQPQFQMIFEEGDPLLEGVNLDMFERIEVDEDGNAI